MVTIEANTDNNCLIVHSAGVIVSSELKKIKKGLEENLLLLQDGFSIIHDVSQLRLYNEEYPILLKDIHEIISGFNPGRIIRVVGNARDTLFKFAQFDQQNNIHKTEFVPNLESAFEVLGIPLSEKVHSEKNENK